MSGKNKIRRGVGIFNYFILGILNYFTLFFSLVKKEKFLYFYVNKYFFNLFREKSYLFLYIIMIYMHFTSLGSLSADL